MPSTSYHEVHLPDVAERRVLWQVLADHLARWVPAHGHVLEIGAGHCSWINAVRADVRVAVDIWPDVARWAAPGVQTRVIDVARDLRTLGDEQFDVVLASNVLEHFDADAAAAVVTDVVAVLRRGGRFLVIQPNFRYAYRRYFDDYTHRSIFTHVSLTNLLRSRALEIDAVVPRFMPYSLRDRRATVRPWLIRAYLRSPIKPLAGQMLIVARRP